MTPERQKKIIRNITIALLCGAIPVWAIHLIGGDWIAKCGQLCAILLIVAIWQYAKHTKNDLLYVFTGGMLLGEGLIPILFLFLVPIPEFTAPLLIDPGFNFFVWLEERFALDAVTYTDWYATMREFLAPTINGVVYGGISVLAVLLVKYVNAKKHQINTKTKQS